MTTGIKRIVICADDFGFSEGVCRGVLELAENERISAVSCLTQGAWWPRFSSELSSVPTVAGGLVSVGLQWNLTNALGNGPSIRSVIMEAYRGKLAARAADTLDMQLDLFRQHWGRLPDFIAGHQQVQQLPGAAEVLIETVQRRFGSNLPMIRNGLSLQPRGMKAKMLASFGGRDFKDRLAAQGLLTNSDFEGWYDYGDEPPYGQHMQHWLARCAPRGLIVCQPGRPGYALDSDPISMARSREFRFLSGDAFPASLTLLGVGLMPFSSRFFTSKNNKSGRSAVR